MKREIEQEYIDKAEKWFIENIGDLEYGKSHSTYNSVINDIAKEIKEGKEPNWNAHYYDLITD